MAQEDIIVTEMLQELPIETIHVITNWLQRGLRGRCDSLASWKIVKFVFLRKPASGPQSRSAPVGDGKVVLVSGRDDAKSHT